MTELAAGGGEDGGLPALQLGVVMTYASLALEWVQLPGVRERFLAWAAGHPDSPVTIPEHDLGVSEMVTALLGARFLGADLDGLEELDGLEALNDLGGVGLGGLDGLGLGWP